MGHNVARMHHAVGLARLGRKGHRRVVVTHARLAERIDGRTLTAARVVEVAGGDDL